MNEEVEECYEVGGFVDSVWWSWGLRTAYLAQKQRVEIVEKLFLGNGGREKLGWIMLNAGEMAVIERTCVLVVNANIQDAFNVSSREGRVTDLIHY